MKSKTLVIVAGVVLLGAAVALSLVLRSKDEPAPATKPAPPVVERGGSSSTASTDSGFASETPEGSQASYPIQLEKLRSKIPDNRYWELDSPTSDVEVAKQRAAKAKARNDLLGRITANEASPEEIRAYYDERRRISSDYLELALRVLNGEAGEVSERDRGMFELTANLHRARLKQVDRDQRDALDRLAKKAGGGGAATEGGERGATDSAAGSGSAAP